MEEENLEKKVEELVERKAEERGIEKDQELEELKKEIVQELTEKDNSEKQEFMERFESDKLSRRQFMKFLGLGAGGLALSSYASAAWSIVQPKSQGVSGIDADTVDGKDASEMGGSSLKINSDGTPYINTLSRTKLRLKNQSTTWGGDSDPDDDVKEVLKDELVMTNVNATRVEFSASIHVDGIKGANTNAVLTQELRINGATRATTQNGTSGETSIKTSSSIGFNTNLSGDDITFYAVVDKVDAGDLSLTGRYINFADKSTTSYWNPPSLSPVWIDWSNNSAGGTTNTSVRLNGSPLANNGTMYASLDSNDTLTITASVNNQTNTFTHSVTLREGKYL